MALMVTVIQEENSQKELAALISEALRKAGFSDFRIDGETEQGRPFSIGYWAKAS